MRPRALSILVALAVAGCEPETTVVRSELTSSAVSLPDSTEHRQFQQALTDAGIPFTTEVFEGREYVRWSGGDDDRVQAIRSNLFGPELPVGRNIHFEGDMQNRFKSWLSENDIAYTTVEARGVEYIVWEAEVDRRVRAWQYFPETEDPN